MAVIVVRPNRKFIVGWLFPDQITTVTVAKVSEAFNIPMHCLMEPDGQLLRQDEYPELYKVIGKHYGGGPQTFRLPRVKSKQDFVEAGEDDPTPAEIKEEIRRHHAAHPDGFGFARG